MGGGGGAVWWWEVRRNKGPGRVPWGDPCPPAPSPRSIPLPHLLEWAVAQQPLEASCRSWLPVSRPMGVLKEDISLSVMVLESVSLVCLSVDETASEQVQGTLSPCEVKAERTR